MKHFELEGESKLLAFENAYLSFKQKKNRSGSNAELSIHIRELEFNAWGEITNESVKEVV